MPKKLKWVEQYPEDVALNRHHHPHFTDEEPEARGGYPFRQAEPASEPSSILFQSLPSSWSLGLTVPVCVRAKDAAGASMVPKPHPALWRVTLALGQLTLEDWEGTRGGFHVFVLNYKCNTNLWENFFEMKQGKKEKSSN